MKLMKEENHQKQQIIQATQKKIQQDLIDLPQEVPQSYWKQVVLTPKFIIITILAIVFVGRNIYYEYTKPPSVIAAQKDQKAKQQAVQISPQLYNRFFWYIILTVIFFVIFILMKRSNDRAEEQRIREQIKKQQEQAQKQKIIQQKGKKIITSMDQFGNVVDQNAFKKKSIVAQNQQNKKDK